MEDELLKYKSQYSVVRHQLGEVYRDFRTRREAWEKEEKRLKDEKESLEGLRETDRIRIEEFKVGWAKDHFVK